MADYEGIVASQKEAGKAEVLIRPSAEGIPGASEDINCRVCHCLAQGSQVTIDALNAVGAQVGDWVLVRRDSTALLRNAMVLIGIPLLGGLMGVVPAYFLTMGFSTRLAIGTLIAALPLLAGMGIAAVTFRRISSAAEPVIVRVLKRASEMPLLSTQGSTVPNHGSLCDHCNISC